MAKGRPRGSRTKKAVRGVLLEETSARAIRAERGAMEGLLRYEWDYYYELAYQRRRRESDLLDALRRGSARDFTFKSWQRAVK